LQFENKHEEAFLSQERAVSKGGKIVLYGKNSHGKGCSFSKKRPSASKRGTVERGGESATFMKGMFSNPGYRKVQGGGDLGSTWLFGGFLSKKRIRKGKERDTIIQGRAASGGWGDEDF